jgi:uncharacterized repeat protein (TIGR02543 family)
MFDLSRVVTDAFGGPATRVGEELKLSGAKKTTALAAAAAVAGFSSVVMWAAPASAATPACGSGGTLLTGNVCEQTFTATGPAVFTPTAQMTKLQVLLVAGGGAGGEARGYGPAGGGGGEVKVVDFSGDTSTDLNLIVGDSGQASSAAEGAATPLSAAAGGDASFSSADPGSSGNGNAGYANWSTDLHGGGGGAGASPSSTGNGYDGGAGAIVSAIAPSGSLFSTDTNCYGGGGAAGDDTTQGTATCGGGAFSSGSPATLVAPTPNTGGGGGSLPGGSAASTGATGLIVVRWNAPTVTLTFARNGHGATIAPETIVVGAVPTKPANPSADGFIFKGWYTDAALTTKADFSAPLSASTTFYAGWDPALAVTGGTLNPLAAPLGITGLSIGLALVLVGRRRSRSAI